jgi:hypothetical protein
MARLPRQYAPFVYGIIQAAITTAVATAIATPHLTDFSMRFVEEWLLAWALAFLTMLPGRGVRFAVHSALWPGVDGTYWRRRALTQSRESNFAPRLLFKSWI